jgi:uncharacterized protein
VTAGGAYFPELHDVAPPTRRALDAMLELLPDVARPVACLLVVPNWGGQSPIDRDAAFARDVGALGGEIVMHGLTHTLGERWTDRLVFGTENESEFAALDADAARDRLHRAREIFAQAFGRAPRWFCAPRWQESPGTRSALDALGIGGRMARNSCVMPSGERSTVRAVWFDDGDRAVTRGAAAVLRRRRVARVLRGEGAMRVALHPRDVERASTREAVRGLFARLTDQGWTARPIDELPVGA